MTLGILRVVKIRDTRINVLYYVLLFAMGLLLLLGLVKNASWNSEFSESRDVRIKPWVSQMSEATLKTITEAASQLPICASTEDFWYDWSDEDMWQYRPTKCLITCLAAERNANVSRIDEACVPQTALSSQDGETVFIPTWSRLTITNASGHVEKSSILSPYAEHMKLAFFVSIASKVPEWEWSSMSTKSLVRSSNKGNIILVVVDSLGRVSRELDKNPRFLVSELFQLAGHREDFLDSAPPINKKNYNASQKRQYPVMRITGANIRISVDCSNRRPTTVTEGHELLKEWSSKMEEKTEDGHVIWCTLHVELPNPDEWAEMSRTTTHDIGIDQTTEQLHTLGVRVVFRKSLRVSYMDPKQIYLMFASTIVVLTLPKYFMLFFITRCLGPLSAIYRRAIYQDFSIANAMVGTASRLLVNAERFKSLGRLSRMGELDKARLAADVVELASECHEFGKTDAITFGHFVSRTVDIMETHPPTKSVFKKGRSDSKSNSIRILLEAAENSEHYSLEDAGNVFSADRRIGLIERVFVPPFLHEAFRFGKGRGSPVQESPLSGEPLGDQGGMEPASSMTRSSTTFSVKSKAEDDMSSMFLLEKRFELLEREVYEKLDKFCDVVIDVLQRLTQLEACGMATHSVSLGPSASTLVKSESEQTGLRNSMAAATNVLESSILDIQQRRIDDYTLNLDLPVNLGNVNVMVGCSPLRQTSGATEEENTERDTVGLVGETGTTRKCRAGATTSDIIASGSNIDPRLNPALPSVHSVAARMLTFSAVPSLASSEDAQLD
eukprot:TRINITY_DN3850_c0_g1_i3.p1 TRINITY_DN3850_c0_g1~~TRINITY_DN3850_c0_g1_i3.p1  ORF type:complete len:791 (-),score=95.22 TRINITY_DN3850_c0_g1_i3:41-2389(-)